MDGILNAINGNYYKQILYDSGDVFILGKVPRKTYFVKMFLTLLWGNGFVFFKYSCRVQISLYWKKTRVQNRYTYVHLKWACSVTNY